MAARMCAATLPHARESAGTARRILTEEMRGHVDDDVLEIATLLLSEVVTNAVLHARTDTRLQVTVDGGGIVVRVSDGSTRCPVRREHADDALNGRGLELVEILADDYGVLSEAHGKTVWFTLGGAGSPGPTGWADTAPRR